tara:strand:- start:549 stop:1832 length:1284 start_codon:yes stop_codon:yes gene_type:complete
MGQHELFTKRLAIILSTFSFFLLMAGLFYLAVSFKMKIDFSSFYSSICALNLNLSPYMARPLDFLNTSVTGAVNLNTPFFVLLFSPLQKINYEYALIIWQLGSFFSLIISARLILKRYELYDARYLLCFMFSFPVIMNAFIGQIGAYVFVCVTLGHHYFKNNKSIIAGILWGGITGIKLFTGLLLIYALIKKDYKAVLSFSITLFITLLIPYYIFGIDIYLGYFNALKSINWYEHAWNGSLLGFILRSKMLLFLTSDPQCIRYLSLGMLAAFSSSYVYLMFVKKEKWQHQAFNLTLIYMLLLNPLGWFYYFLLLLHPLATLASTERNFSFLKKIIFLIFFILLAFPRHSDAVKVATLMPIRLSIGSQYFYALILGLGLMLWQDTKKSLVMKYESFYAFLKVIVIFIIYAATFYFTVNNLSKLLTVST